MEEEKSSTKIKNTICQIISIDHSISIEDYSIYSDSILELTKLLNSNELDNNELIIFEPNKKKLNTIFKFINCFPEINITLILQGCYQKDYIDNIIMTFKNFSLRILCCVECYNDEFLKYLIKVQKNGFSTLKNKVLKSKTSSFKYSILQEWVSKDEIFEKMSIGYSAEEKKLLQEILHSPNIKLCHDVYFED